MEKYKRKEKNRWEKIKMKKKANLFYQSTMK